MASKLPYMASPGQIPKILAKVQEARRPDRFTQDFLETKLGHSGGSARPIIPLLKRLGFLSTDGTPTGRYDSFRNEHSQGFAMAQGIKEAYSELYDRNEYAHEMTRDKLAGLVTEVTGAAKDDTVTKCITSSFEALKEFADFEAEETPADTQGDTQANQPDNNIVVNLPSQKAMPPSHDEDVKFAIGYTINLNLPETSDPEVFNAIFKGLKEHLLTKS